MALQLGNLLGAAANATTAFGKPKSLKNFLHHINDFGVQVTNNFEVNIAGLEDITFFAQSVSFGGVHMKFEELKYNGRSIPVPTYIDYDHSAQIEVIGDGNGYIYAAVSNFLFSDSITLLNNGIEMTITCLTGDPKYKGSVITLHQVRPEKIGGFQFAYSGGDVQKFQIDLSYLDFTFTPGGLKKASGVLGAVRSLAS